MNSSFVGKQVSLIHVSCLPDHSASNHLTLAVAALSRYPSARQLSVSGLDFAIGKQARRSRPAVSSSLSYGLVFHLLLLSTTGSLRSQLHSVTGRRAFA